MIKLSDDPLSSLLLSTIALENEIYPFKVRPVLLRVAVERLHHLVSGAGAHLAGPCVILHNAAVSDGPEIEGNKAMPCGSAVGSFQVSLHKAASSYAGKLGRVSPYDGKLPSFYGFRFRPVILHRG